MELNSLKIYPWILALMMSTISIEWPRIKLFKFWKIECEDDNQFGNEAELWAYLIYNTPVKILSVFSTFRFGNPIFSQSLYFDHFYIKYIINIFCRRYNVKKLIKKNIFFAHWNFEKCRKFQYWPGCLNGL